MKDSFKACVPVKVAKKGKGFLVKMTPALPRGVICNLRNCRKL